MLSYTRMVSTFTLLISGLLANSPAMAVEEIDLSAVQVQSRPTSTPLPAKAQTKTAAPSQPTQAATPKPQVQTPAAPAVEASAAAPSAQNTGSQFSLSLDALGEALIYSPWLTSPSYGAGGQAFIDWRPIQVLSFGVGGQYAYFFGTPTFKLASFDLGGRIFPLSLGENPSGEFYLQGGVGLNLLVLPPAYGHFHGYAGLGWRQFLGGNLALDMGGQYDFYSPIASSSHAASAKLGLTFLFGRTDWRETAEEKKPTAKTFAVGGPWSGITAYTWTVGDDLRKVAAKIYGDEGLYPMLVDANPTLLTDYRNLRPGARLRVPAPPTTQDEVDHLEKAAFENTVYLKWQKVSEELSWETAHSPRVNFYTWRKGDTLPAVAEKLYGDGDLYPLLVDANKKSLIHPANLVHGKTLRVPPLPSLDQLEDIRYKGYNESEYIWWRNVSENE